MMESASSAKYIFGSARTTHADLAMPGASFQANDRFDFGTREVLERQARAFAGSVPVDDPRVSPVHAKLGELPPSLVVFGACELLHYDIVRLADALDGAGTKVTRHEAPDMPHDPAVFAAYHPSGKGALHAMARFVEERLDEASVRRLTGTAFKRASPRRGWWPSRWAAPSARCRA